MKYKIKYIKNQRGVSLVESALLACMISLVVIGGAKSLGVKVNDKFVELDQALCSESEGNCDDYAIALAASGSGGLGLAGGGSSSSQSSGNTNGGTGGFFGTGK